ncbi:MAG: PqqD family protein [Alphaproteobacteria bacterium]
MKQQDRFSETEVDGEVILLHLDDGTFFSLTETAAAIWALIDGKRNRAAIQAELAKMYDADDVTIAAQLGGFIVQLQAAGFVAPD